MLEKSFCLSCVTELVLESNQVSVQVSSLKLCKNFTFQAQKDIFLT